MCVRILRCSVTIFCPSCKVIIMFVNLVLGYFLPLMVCWWYFLLRKMRISWSANSAARIRTIRQPRTLATIVTVEDVLAELSPSLSVPPAVPLGVSLSGSLGVPLSGSLGITLVVTLGVSQFGGHPVASVWLSSTATPTQWFIFLWQFKFLQHLWRSW